VPRLPAANNALSLASADRNRQEDTLVATWNGKARATLVLTGLPVDLTRQTHGNLTLALDLKVDAAPDAAVTLSQGCGDKCSASVDVSEAFRSAANKGWVTLTVPLAQFKRAGANMRAIMAPFALTTSGTMSISIDSVKLAPGSASVETVKLAPGEGALISPRRT